MLVLPCQQKKTESNYRTETRNAPGFMQTVAIIGHRYRPRIADIGIAVSLGRLLPVRVCYPSSCSHVAGRGRESAHGATASRAEVEVGASQPQSGQEPTAAAREPHSGLPTDLHGHHRGSVAGSTRGQRPPAAARRSHRRPVHQCCRPTSPTCGSSRPVPSRPVHRPTLTPFNPIPKANLGTRHRCRLKLQRSQGNTCIQLTPTGGHSL